MTGHTHQTQGHEHDRSHDHAPDASEHDHPHDHDHPEGRLRRVIGIFVGHSHDPGDSIDDALTSDARGIRALKVSLALLGITAVAQLAVVIVSGSVALLADTIHNFSDALTAIPLWIAFALGARAATRRYTFGYRRAEDLAGLFVLLMIAGSAVLAAFESISRLIHPQPISNIPIVLAAGVIGFLGNEAVALYRIRVGRSIGSAALVADGYHARTDGLTSLAVVGGALGVAAGYPLADPLVGLLITAVILVVLKQATGQMLGRLMDAVEPDLVEQVETIAASVPEVQSVDRLRLRWLSHALEASMAITVDCDLSVAEGHRVSEEVRHRLLHEVHRLDTAVIHVNPCGPRRRGPPRAHAAPRLVRGASGPRSHARRSGAMEWVTHEHPRTDRIACPWLIRAFIDPEAEIVFVPRDQVLAYAEREGATSFDAPGATYTHRDGLCSFEVLIEEHGLGSDPALTLMARVVHGADVSEDRDATPQSRGLLAIADGFALLDVDDQRQLELELPVYDALYAWARHEVASRTS